MTLRSDLDQNGFAFLRGAFDSSAVRRICSDLAAATASLEVGEDASLRRSRGAVFAVRNLQSVWPGVTDLVRTDPLLPIITAIVGEDCGLVRAILFDKPAERSWSLPWHRDLSVAVADNAMPLPPDDGPEAFSRPTTKAGVPHLEAPGSLLREMLTVRIHLDPTDEANGCLRVLPGSHLDGKEPRELRGTGDEGIPVRAGAGDVRFMRPLLMHRSLSGREGSECGRRIIHLEIAPRESLAAGVRWASFTRVLAHPGPLGEGLPGGA